LPIGGSIGADYTQIHTVKDTYYYQPRDTIPVGPGSTFGLRAFVIKLQNDLKTALLDAPIAKTRAARQMIFVVRREERGRLSFLDAFEVGGDQTTENTHSIEFSFCLTTETGQCLPTVP
jgi:hypothetical protein